MSASNFVFVVVIGLLATVWIVWPAKYQKWVDGLFQNWGPAAEAGKNRVRSMWPFSMTAKPWYPQYLRAVGVLLWIFLIGMIVLSFEK